MSNSPQVEVLPACPLCGGSRFRPLTTPGHWIGMEVFSPLNGQIGLSQCRDCGLRFVNPRPTQELLGRFYQGDTYACHRPADPQAALANAAYLLNLLTPFAPAGRPPALLDFGCGAGDFLIHAQRAGWTAVGFEPGQQGRNAGLARGLKVVGRVEELADQKFDFITLSHVFEHVADHATTLRTLRTLLAPGGCVYLEVPNADSLRARLSWPVLSRRCGFDQRYRAFPIHLTYFDARTMRRLLEQHGFHVERFVTVGVGLEELFTQTESRDQPADSVPPPMNGAPRARRSVLRRLIKKLIFGTGLGDSLGVICRAQRGANQVNDPNRS